MTFPKTTRPASNFEVSRPRFNSYNTQDRLREGSGLAVAPMLGQIPKNRRSVFKEVGLDEVHDDGDSKPRRSCEEREFGELTGLHPEPSATADNEGEPEAEGDEEYSTKSKDSWFSKLTQVKRPRIKSAASAPPPTTSSFSRIATIAMLIAVVLPTVKYNNGRSKVEMSGADAGVIPHEPRVVLEDRANSAATVCKRWAGQSAVLNGTLYYYGGRSKTSAEQATNTWNNDLLTLDLTKSWPITSPALTGLAQPSGPPAVSLGYLWNDYHNLYLYGGQFADDPYQQPAPVSTWKYDIKGQAWKEFASPKTSAGNFSDPAGQPVQRAAEGAGISVPELGVSWYFGGHLDLATTPGWSNQVPRVYLKSLLEFTHPGFANNGVDGLRASGAGEGGVYRNITQGGIQEASGFSERADGVLVFVPGWGPMGILLGLGGGTTNNDVTTDQFSSMQTIDVYDIKTSTWYHQQTTGQAPEVRVNPCAVVFSAPDASSFNIYLYGGQNLIPYKEQIQYNDMWILTIPSFTWVKVDASNGPPGRAGHTCNARDGQMVVFGGYIGTSQPCESPGIYNFDASNLQWKSSFDAADHPADLNPENSIASDSFGYKVPAAVQSVIGGSSEGGATATQPASGPASQGPFATGKSPVFTVTQSGSAATVTAWAPDGTVHPVAEASPNSISPGYIAAAVLAALAGVAAFYLGFCAWLYRRQVRAYKQHMLVANRYSGAAPQGFGAGLGGGAVMKEKLLRKQRRSSESYNPASEQFGWVGPQGAGAGAETGKLISSSSEQPTPGSSGHASRPSQDRRDPWSWYEGAGLNRNRSTATRSTASGGSSEELLDGRQPNFFSVVMGPRRALRVVNGIEGREGE